MFKGHRSRIWAALCFAAMLVGAMGAGGCAPNGAANGAQAGQPQAEQAQAVQPQAEQPQVLTVALVPAEDIMQMIDAFEPAMNFMEREVGVEIEMFKATDYTAVVEAMRAGKVDVAYFGPLSFVLAAERANARAIVAGADEPGKLGTYHSIMITHKDSGLKSMEDVQRRVGELTLSFVDPASTSGHLIPRGHLQSLGINADTDFKEVVFAGGHDASILAVQARKADLGATWEGPYERAIEEGLVTPDDVFVIWKSDGIPSSPIAVRGDLDEALVQRLQQAFLNLPQEDPAAFQQKEEMWEGNKGYVKVTNADYDYIRQLAEALGQI